MSSQVGKPVITGAPLDGPADCTLACDEGHLTAHKIMLCAHSKYLQDILSRFPNAEHPIIILTELNITDIKILVNYMYTGELVITNDGSPSSLLRAAQILKIDSLTDFEDEDEHEDYHQEQPLSPQDYHQEQQQQQQQHSPKHNSGNHHHNNNNINNNNNHQNHHNHHEQQLSPKHEHLSERLLLASSPKHQQISSPIKDSNNKIRCHLCNIGLSDVKCLYRHVLTRHLPEKWGYKCEFCDREFSRDDHLMRHYTTKHKNREFNREKIRETRRLNREMAKNFHDQVSKIGGITGIEGLEGLDSLKDDQY